MYDYTLTFTLGGEKVSHPYTHLRYAEAAFDGLTRNPDCSKAVLKGMGYVIREWCAECENTGYIAPTSDTTYEPAEASAVRCRACGN